jgi:hypothetical protein
MRYRGWTNGQQMRLKWHLHWVASPSTKRSPLKVCRPVSGTTGVLLTYLFPDGHDLQVVASRVANDAGEQNRPPTASAIARGGPSTLPRDQLREEVQRWLSPPDPTTNYTMARSARLEGTAQWFLQGRTFKSWKSTGSLLWIHGKRVFVILPYPLTADDLPFW